MASASQRTFAVVTVTVIGRIGKTNLKVMTRAWRAEYTVGHEVLDEQHRHILSLMDALEHAADGEGREHADVVLEHLHRYLRFHFDTEEQVLADAGYEKLEEHSREHRQLEQQVDEYMAQMRATGRVDLPEILRVLGDWVHHHMTGSDQKWAQELFAT